MKERRDTLLAELFRLKEEGFRLRREYEEVLTLFLRTQQELRRLRSTQELEMQSAGTMAKARQ